MTTEEARREAYRICDTMQSRMRAMGVVTTAHYDCGIELIEAALLKSSGQESSSMFIACVWYLGERWEAREAPLGIFCECGQCPNLAIYQLHAFEGGGRIFLCESCLKMNGRPK